MARVTFPPFSFKRGPVATPYADSAAFRESGETIHSGQARPDGAERSRRPLLCVRRIRRRREPGDGGLGGRTVREADSWWLA